MVYYVAKRSRWPQTREIDRENKHGKECCTQSGVFFQNIRRLKDMTNSGAICMKCGESLDSIDLAAEPRIPCPNCGSTSRAFNKTIVSGLRMFGSLLGRLKNPSLPSNKKLRWESFTGYEFSHSLQKMVHKVRMFDKDTDEYVERVTDIETGEVIHECVEPFTKHIGHGSAKRKP